MASGVPKGPADYPRTADSVDGWLEHIGLVRPHLPARALTL